MYTHPPLPPINNDSYLCVELSLQYPTTAIPMAFCSSKTIIYLWRCHRRVPRYPSESESDFKAFLELRQTHANGKEPSQFIARTPLSLPRLHLCSGTGEPLPELAGADQERPPQQTHLQVMLIAMAKSWRTGSIVQG